jgi:hypothetical protein
MSQSGMRTVTDVFDAFGGSSAMAKAIGLKDRQPAVRAWKSRGSIPPAYWPAITRAAKRRGIKWITTESLLYVRVNKSEAA